MADVSVPLLNLSDISKAPNSLADLQQMQANTGLVNQQAQGAALQNANAAISYQLRRNALLNFTGQNSPAVDYSALPSDDSGETEPDDIGLSPATDAAHVAQTLRSRYFVNPAGTPAQQQQIAMAALSGDEGLLKYATTQRDMSVQSQTARNQYDANNLYDAMHAVVDSAPGNGMAQLEAVAPKTVARIRKQTPDLKEEDELARDFAAHVSGSAHQYTGRELLKREDGVYVDKVTGFPVPSVPVSGLSATQYEELWKQANTLVGVKQSDGSEVQQPQWEANGFPSAASWISRAAAQWEAHATAPSHPAFEGTDMEHPGSAISHDAVRTAADRLGARQSAPPPPNASTGSVPAADPVLKQALGDPEYKLVSPPVRRGVSQTPAQAKEAEAIVSARQDLMKDANDATSAAAAALQYSKAAQQIMQSKGAPVVGLWGPAAKLISSVYGGVNASNYQEVAKYLGNAALNGAKQMYGPKMTQGEVKLQLEELSPSTHMTDDAINELLDTNVRAAQYTIASARRVKPYLASGNDPRSFNQWTEQYWQRANSVNPQRTGPVAITTKAQYDALPKGASYTFNGRAGVKK